MTESEALEFINERIDIIKRVFPEITDYLEALELSAKALKKQIAMKPNKAIDKSWGIENEVNVCPVCDYYLTPVHFIPIDENEVKGTDKVSYCETCGQKIDYNE